MQVDLRYVMWKKSEFFHQKYVKRWQVIQLDLFCENDVYWQIWQAILSSHYKVCFAQCGIFRIFLSLTFYVKSNLAILGAQNLQFWPLWRTVHFLKVLEILKIWKFCVTKKVKETVFETEKMPNLISRKIWVAEKSRFPPCVLYIHIVKISWNQAARFYSTQYGNLRIFLLLRFPWNQNWLIQRCKTCRFYTFRGYGFWFWCIFALFEGWNMPYQQKTEPQKWQKRQF